MIVFLLFSDVSKFARDSIVTAVVDLKTSWRFVVNDICDGPDAALEWYHIIVRVRCAVVYSSAARRRMLGCVVILDGPGSVTNK